MHSIPKRHVRVRSWWHLFHHTNKNQSQNLFKVFSITQKNNIFYIFYYTTGFNIYFQTSLWYKIFTTISQKKKKFFLLPYKTSSRDLKHEKISGTDGLSRGRFIWKWKRHFKIIEQLTTLYFCQNKIEYNSVYDPLLESWYRYAKKLFLWEAGILVR